MATNYSAYFDIDEKYFPQVNDSTISMAAPDFWLTTYPHETFVSMLANLERILARQEMRALWVEGAYGTGKSQCVYALKKFWTCRKLNSGTTGVSTRRSSRSRICWKS